MFTLVERKKIKDKKREEKKRKKKDVNNLHILNFIRYVYLTWE